MLIAAELRGTGKLPVVGFVTFEEEGSRFPRMLLGARSVLGKVKADELDQVKDAAGVSWRAALEEAHAEGCAVPLAAGDAPFHPPFRPRPCSSSTSSRARCWSARAVRSRSSSTSRATAV
jgi:hypothetical protein